MDAMMNNGPLERGLEAGLVAMNEDQCAGKIDEVIPEVDAQWTAKRIGDGSKAAREKRLNEH